MLPAGFLLYKKLLSHNVFLGGFSHRHTDIMEQDPSFASEAGLGCDDHRRISRLLCRVPRRSERAVN